MLTPITFQMVEYMNHSISFRNPILAVDIIIEVEGGIVFIERRNPPLGWALPGGFVDYGESLETAAQREAQEETSLDVELIEQFFTYSIPDRDPRQHTVSTVYIARAKGRPQAGDDAGNITVCPLDTPPDLLAFDHNTIINDYHRYLNGQSKKEIFARRLCF